MSIKPNRRDLEAFENWCKALAEEGPTPTGTVLALGQLIKENRAIQTDVEAAEAAIESMIEQRIIPAAIDADSLIPLNLSGHGQINPSISIDLKQEKTPKKLPQKLAHFAGISVQRSLRAVRLSNLRTWQLSISNNEGSPIILKGCWIRRLVVGQKTAANLTLENCFVAEFEVMHGKNLGSFYVRGGTIRAVLCPPPDADNPFQGSVEFDQNVIFPTSKRKSDFYDGAQGYRNVRAHLEKLQNSTMANRMRALELKSERQADSGLNWLVNWVFGTFGDYGQSPGRPLLWILGIYVATAALLFKFFDTEPGLPEEWYNGWMINLLDGGWVGEAWRAGIAPFQSILNPFNIFGLRRSVIPAGFGGQVLLGFQGLFSDALLLMSILGIRRRFKMH